MLYKNPEQDPTAPWERKDVDNMAQFVLHRHKYELYDSDDDGHDSSNDETSSDEDSDESSSEEDWSPVVKPKKKYKKAKHKIQTTKTSKYVAEESDDEDFRKPTSRKETERTNKRLEQEEIAAAKQDMVENLINQMKAMSIEDKGYGLLYYKAIKLDPDVKKVVREPLLILPVQINEAPSPNYRQKSGNIQGSLGSNQAPYRREDMTCYGCGEKGHGMQMCPDINDLITKGLISRDSSGKLAMKDGSRIFRVNSETFVKAVERQTQGAQNHFFQAVTYLEEDEEDTYKSDDKNQFVFNVTQHAKDIRQKGFLARKKLDGVYPPPLNPKEKGKYAKKQVPVDVRDQAYDPHNDDAIMEDGPSPEKEKMTKEPKKESYP